MFIAISICIFFRTLQNILGVELFHCRAQKPKLEAVLFKQGSTFTPGKFFLKPLKASQKRELPWKVERATHHTNQICQEYSIWIGWRGQTK